MNKIPKLLSLETPIQFFTKFIVSITKDNIININLANKGIFSISLNEESRNDFAYFKSLLRIKFVSPSYHALGACLSP
jgi:hypothetical protein